MQFLCNISCLFIYLFRGVYNIDKEFYFFLTSLEAFPLSFSTPKPAIYIVPNSVDTF